MNQTERQRQREKAGKAESGRSAPSSPGQQVLTIGQQTLTIEQAIRLAVQFQMAGRLPKAESIYQQILQADPHQPDALHLFGVASHQMGKYGTAVDLITKALAIKPAADARYNLGLALQDMGKLDEAVASYHQALVLKPDFAMAHYNLGNAFKELGRLDEAVASYRQALALTPGFADAHNNLGAALQDLGRLDDAVASYRQALVLTPDFAGALSNLGIALQGLGRLDEAVASFHKALVLKPDFAGAHINLGNALHDLGRLDDAVASYHQALVLKPDTAGAHYDLGIALHDLGRLDDAVASYHKALVLKPDFSAAHNNLIYAEQFRTGVTLRKLKSIHGEWDKQFGAPLKKEWRDHGNIPDPERRLRIGFVSPDLGRHPVGFFVVGLLEHRQEKEVEFICYSDRAPDELTERLIELSDEWTDARGVSDEDLSRRVRSDRIDILIDLAGHTAKNRLLVFARRPAPVQVTWAGYVGSTGLSAMDYLIADARHVPEGAERHYSERVIRLPDGNICYHPPDDAPRVGPLPFERRGFITFGCFNNPAKVNNLVLSTWAEILKAVPNSRLILKYRHMDAAGNRNRILDQFGARGVEGSRLTLEGKSPHSELLARYNDVDIALDTFPYSGGLTTCEAVWMGVPVLTKPGETFAGRHSLSHLTNVGAADFVSDDLPDYVSKAVQLANDVPRLKGLRSGLRERMARSALCDGEKFATDFTSAMRLIWQEWCSRGQAHSNPGTVENCKA